MENRRAFLRLAVFGLASSALGARAAQAAVGPALAPVGATAPWWLVAPLEPGSPLGLGWRLVALAPALNGAVTLRLAHDDGRLARIDLCLREGAPRGPAASRYVDFVVMDGGNGDRPMDESLGRAVRRLAAIVGDNEERDTDALGALEPHADRVWRHADALVIPRADADREAEG